jgi:hypothetical protein
VSGSELLLVQGLIGVVFGLIGAMLGLWLQRRAGLLPPRARPGYSPPPVERLGNRPRPSPSPPAKAEPAVSDDKREPADWSGLPGSAVTELNWCHGGQLGVPLEGPTDRRLQGVATFRANLPPDAERLTAWRILRREIADQYAAAVYTLRKEQP